MVSFQRSACIGGERVRSTLLAMVYVAVVYLCKPRRCVTFYPSPAMYFKKNCRICPRERSS